MRYLILLLVGLSAALAFRPPAIRMKWSSLRKTTHVFLSDPENDVAAGAKESSDLEEDLGSAEPKDEDEIGEGELTKLLPP